MKVALIADKAFDLHKSPLVSLLEVKLSQRDSILLLERAEIDKILQEQQLQLMFSVTGVTERRAAGKLLKADLLILFRAKEKNQARQLDIIVAETESGLRLLVQTIVWSDDPLSDMDRINGLISQALEKYQSRIRYICAVPPFVSNDLSHQYDYLQTAYARLVEQTLLQYEGVIVAEMEEARAIAQELELAGESRLARRNLPLYILGEYRNDGVRKNRKTSIKLTLQQGRMQLKTITTDNLQPENVASFLRKKSWELLELVAKAELSPPSPQTEAKLLAKRAKEFMQIANWPEALALLEASLLVNPDQPSVHHDAVSVLFQLMRLSYDPYGSDETFIKKARRGLEYYVLGLKHVEWIVLSNSFIERRFDSISGFLSRVPAEYLCLGYKSQLIARDCEKAERQRNDLLVYIMNSKVNTGQLDDRIAHLLVHNYFCVPHDDPNLSIEDNYARRLEGIRLFQNLPKAQEWTYKLGHDVISAPSLLLTQGYEDFVQQIATIPNKNIQAAVQRLRKDIQHVKDLAERRKARKYKLEHPEVADSKEDYDVVSQRLELVWTDSDGKSHLLTSDLWGWLSCSDNIDFIWGPKEIFLMKEKGMLKRIYQSKGRFFNIIDPCYDGKYVWAPVTGGGPLVGPLVLVIDPVTEDVIAFNAEDGLPPWALVAAAPLNPGRICLAGGLNGRGWCAILEITKSGQKSVDVFHEARRNIMRNKQRREAALNPYLAFAPRYMKVISDPNDNSKQRVLLGRSTTFWEAHLLPLIIDPQTRSVDVLPDFIGSHLLNNYFTCHEGSLYWATRNVGGEDHPSLWCIGFDTLKRTAPVTRAPEDGFVVFADSAIHIIGEHWWTAKSFDDEFTQLKVKFPRGAWYYRKICHSNHYGLIMISDKRAYKVEFKNLSMSRKNIPGPVKAAVEK